MFVEITMQTKDYHYDVNLLAILNLCYRRNLSLVLTLNYIINTSYPNPSVPDDVCYQYCVTVLGKWHSQITVILYIYIKQHFQLTWEGFVLTVVEGGDLNGDEAHGVVDGVEAHGVGDHGVVDGVEAHAVEVHGVEAHGLGDHGVVDGVEAHAVEAHGVEVHGVGDHGVAVHGVEAHSS